MSGFSGVIILKQELEKKLENFKFPAKTQSHFERRGVSSGKGYSIQWYSNNKFTDDKYLNQEDTLLVGFDGIRLDGEMFKNGQSKDEFIASIKATKGSFSALYFDTNSKELLLFADQTSSRQIFYFCNDSFFAFSSSIFLLVDILKHFDVSLNLSEPASYMMLSLGYLLEDYTLVSEIKKVKAGHYTTLSNNIVHQHIYHNFYKETIYTKLTDDLLKELDVRFKHSIKLEYEKDIQSNYNHLATLSGGLDSRLNVMLANEYGYKDITAVTFSEGFKSDELTARRISSDLALKHIVLLLNNGFQLYDIETPLLLNNCSVYYFGAAQTLAAARRINFEHYGLFHNGGLAESSKGGYLNAPNHLAPALQKHYAVSDQYFHKIGDTLIKSILDAYPNDEMFVTYNRGFNAIHNGSWMTMPFTDSVYSYMDTDFADLAYAIDPKLRYRGKMTVEWIKQKHPSLARYPWQYGINPTNNERRIFMAKVMNKLKRYVYKNNDVPVPFDEWYKKDINLRTFIENQYKNSLAWGFLPNQLKKDVEDLFNQGNVTEKLLCVSFLKSIEMLFIEQTND